MKTILALFFTLFYYTAVAQYLNPLSYGRYDSINVEAFGKNYLYPWAGGLNTPQFSAADLNGDGINDLFVFDRDGQVVRTFINGGSQNKIDYSYHPAYETAFPLMKDYAILFDYNNDSQSDLFTSYNGDFKVYDNISLGNTPDSTHFKLRLFKSPFDSTKRVDFLSHKYYLSNKKFIYTNVFNISSDYPGLIDIDDDGDMDIFAFGNASNSVGFYRNVSVENYGTTDSLDFRFETGCWGHFAEDNSLFRLYFGYCKSSGKSVSFKNPMTISSGIRHTGSSILIHDFDSNGLKDIILGDVSYNSALLAFNNGSKADAKMTTQDTAFPRYSKPVNVQTFPASFYFDVNNDGVKDMVSAPNSSEFFSNINQVHYYSNSNTDNKPLLQFERTDFLVDNMIDLGTDAHPIFIDIDGDTLLDIIAGNRGVFSGVGVYESRIAYYKNVGTKTNPSYKLITRDFLSLPNGVDTGLCPTAGDIDNDGDIDLIMGTQRGHLYFYENIAINPSDSCVFRIKSTAFDNKIFGKSILPTLYDVNHDGKLDLIIGGQVPTLSYYENIGTLNSPDFDASNGLNNFGGIKSSNVIGDGYLSPFMEKLDTSGKYDDLGKEYLFVGTSTGYFYVISNIDAQNRTNASVIDSFYVYSKNVSIAGGDITGDNKPDFVFGHKTGGMSILLKDGGNIIVQPPKEEPRDTTFITEQKKVQNKVTIYPNPTNNIAQITGLNNSEQNSIAELYTMNGELKWVERISNGDLIPLQGLSKGVYYLKIKTHPRPKTIKIIKN